MRNLFAKTLSALLIAALLLSPIALMEEVGDITPEAVDPVVEQADAELGEDILAEPEALFEAGAVAEAVAEAGTVIVFPDANFNKYVYDNFDLDKDGTLTQAEIDAVTAIDVYFDETLTPESRLYGQMTDLSGIENFKNLEQLNCVGNALTALDLSGNPKLQRVYCGYNKIATLNTGNSASIVELYCNDNQLTSLDLGSCAALVEINCSGNQLTMLDVDSCPMLQQLGCFDNKLTSLDISKNPGLQNVWCEGNAIASLDISNCPFIAMYVDPAHYDYYENEFFQNYVFYRSDNFNVVLSFERGMKVVGGNPVPDDVATNLIVATREGKKNIKIVNNMKTKVNMGAQYLVYLYGYTAKNFKSSKPAVATVDAYGVVTPVAAGKTNITYKVGKKKYTLKVTVIDPTTPTVVYLDRTGTIKATKGETITLTAATAPGTDAGGFKWSSSNKKVATVDANGVITCLKAGKATITCTAVRGNKKAKVKVRVK